MRQDLKKAIVLFSGLTLFACALSGHAAENKVTLYQKAKQAATALKGRVPETELRQLALDLGGADPEKARAAVRRCAELGATKMVALALEYPASSVQIEAAKQLKGSEGTEVVMSAVDALEVANTDLFFGGAEIKIANKELKSLLIDFICDATGCDPQDVPAGDRASVQSLIDTVRQSFR